MKRSKISQRCLDIGKTQKQLVKEINESFDITYNTFIKFSNGFCPHPKEDELLGVIDNVFMKWLSEKDVD